MRFLTLALLAPALAAEVALPPLFSDHAVLQAGVGTPVWGTAAEGERVTVRIAGVEASTTATGGRWLVRLPALAPTTTGQDLVVQGTNTLTVRQVLIGEVWLCGGQSNMERQLGLRKGQPPIRNYEAEAATADLPALRFFNVPQTFSETPAPTLTGRWEVMTPTSALSCSAVGFFFARALHQARGGAVGLIHSSWGGTNATCWTPQEDLLAEPTLARHMEKYRKDLANLPAAQAAWKAKEAETMAAWEKAVAAATAAGTKPPAKPEPPKDPRQVHKSPGFLYHGMIAPLAPYGLRGVLWYQGENNAKVADEYQVLLPAMIRGWRRTFEQPDLPFLIVEIAPHERMTPEIREAQQRIAAAVPHAGIVSTIDVGDAKDIHPPDKRPVGERLAALARRQVYGEDVVASGPRFTGLRIDGPRAVLTFAHADQGLTAPRGALGGFTIAGADGRFVDAQAVIAGDTVVVTAAEVPAPTAVRYGWSAVPEAFLFNGAGWPAFPFRTDLPKPSGTP